MKKLAILFGLMILSSQLPLSPAKLMPGNLADTLEFGKQWTAMFLRAFGPVSASPSNEAQPGASSNACPLAELASMRIPDPAVALDVLSAADHLDFEIDVPGEILPVQRVNVRVPRVPDARISAEAARKMEKAIRELHLKMQEMDRLRIHVETRHALHLQMLKTGQHLNEVRPPITTKSA